MTPTNNAWIYWEREWNNAYKFFKSEGNTATKARLKKQWMDDFMKILEEVNNEQNKSME